MTQITIEITSCKQCPYFETANRWSSDGWDRMEDWICTRTTPNQKIQGAVEWHEESKIKIPDWCPGTEAVKCKHPHTKHVVDSSTFPYGDSTEYDKCIECGEHINVEVK